MKRVPVFAVICVPTLALASVVTPGVAGAALGIPAVDDPGGL